MGLHTANQRNDWECGVQKKNKKQYVFSEITLFKV